MSRDASEKGSIQEQIIENDIAQGAPRPGVVLGLDRLAYLRHSRFRDRGLIPQRIGEGGLDITHRQSAYKRGDHQRFSALVLETCLPNRREANAAVVPRSLGRSKVIGPAVVLTVAGR